MNSMAYSSYNKMMFGTALKPVTTKNGLVIGGGYVIPEIIAHPRPGSEKTLKSLLREFERANEDALEKCILVGFPAIVIENEHVFQMTDMADWGMEIALQTQNQINEYQERYGLKAAYRATIADIRKPDMVDMRVSDRTQKIIKSFEGCAKHADIISIESMGGKEIFDYSIIRNDIEGLLFAVVLKAMDMQWLWKQIVSIAKKNKCIAGGDTNCAQANTAMFMAGGYLSKDVSQSLAALVRAMGASSSLVAYECGATGPGKNCAYENPIIKAITGVPISTEGKTSACAHMDLCGNVMAAVCDLWSNEAVEYHNMFGGTTPAVFTEILGYDAAAMNSSIQLGYQKEYQACLINSDRYRSHHGFILCPDNAWEIGRSITENDQSYYSRARAAALKCSMLLRNDKLLRFSGYEYDALGTFTKEIENLPDNEGDFVDKCLCKFKKVNGFRPASYGL